jgi:hypothetical protein
MASTSNFPLVQLKAGELPITAELLEREVLASQSTGKELIRLQVRFESENDDDTVAVEDFINSEQFVQTDADNPSKERRWKIGQHSNSYREGAPETTFSWELFEVEDIKISKLVIAGSEYTPYKYSEEFDNKGRLTIEARVELTEVQESKTRKLKPYFQVVRKGVNDTPREMRFGQMVWSKKDDRYRMNLLLVDKAYDEPASRGFFQPQFSNIEDSVAISLVGLRSLLDKLVDKGVLSAAERDAISDVEKTERDKEIWEFDRVADLDEWLDK